MGRKTRSKKDEQIDFLTEQLHNNAMAIQEGPTKKRRYSLHDVRNIKAMKEPQERAIRAYNGGYNLVMTGCAGTGKTLIGSYLALTDIFTKDSHRNNLIIIRSAVPTRDMGFLKGDINEKEEIFEDPYRETIGYLLQKNLAYENLKESGIIQFRTTSYLRGLTWDNAVVIFDEVQNCNYEEIHTVMTRLGTNSKIIVMGDFAQNDLYRSKYDTSGYENMMKVVAEMSDSFDVVTFTSDDVVRGDFAKAWIKASERALK
jgi:phosphate starvation-inducible protein PhoH and related proteins